MNNPKKIFIYGDSLTWGYNPANGTRFPYEETWPGVMEKLLGNNYRIITEALAGRTTCWEVPYAPYRNGKEFLPMLLESHMPVDLVIIMLGVNDMMKLVGKTADESAWGLVSLIRIAQTPVFGGAPPKIMIIAPPVPSKLDKFDEMAFGGKEEELNKLAGCYEAVAKTALCEFMNANEFIKVNGSDGVHCMPDMYKILGERAAEKVKTIL